MLGVVGSPLWLQDLTVPSLVGGLNLAERSDELDDVRPMSRTIQRIGPHALALLIGGLSISAPARADDARETRFFESRIRPVLVQRCYECHSDDTGAEGGLRLDSPIGIRAGGDRGPAIVPGDADKSWVYRAISHEDPELRMPPKAEPLSDEVIADFRRWIQQGAIDPRRQADDALMRADDESSRAENRWRKGDGNHWAYKAPIAQPAPENDPWCRNDVDRYVLNRLRQNGLEPSHDASHATLLRRLHFDLVGLPPTPDRLQSFTSRVDAKGIDVALENEVDSLLESSAFGERWGRHWLDVARYAESSGKEANISFPYAWRFRDYVIDAVNEDIPFDQFLSEQIAGDLMSAHDPAQRTRRLIATGFLALGPKNLDAADPRQFDADLVDEQIDAVTRVFMASSVACARCHDHKFDPFSMDDYYALAGIFSSTKTFFGTAVSPANRVGGDPLVLPRLKQTLVLHKSISPKKVRELKAQKAALQKEKEEKKGKLTIRDALRIIWRTGGIDGQLEKVDDNGQALPLAMGVTDQETIADAPRLLRGEVDRPDALVRRAFPSVIGVAKSPSISNEQSGRLALARWLTQPDHPLTTRVFVNRVWSHLFGAGLVASVDDFGTTGQRPSHPALLDRMAIEFVEQGWSLKKLVRRLVLSRTYRQDSAYDSDAFEKDPENRFYWRMSKRRIEAEAMRDAMLSVSGELDRSRPAGSWVGRVIGDRPISLVGLNRRLPQDLDGSVHRSVYLPVMRDRLPDVLDVFDFAEPSLVTGRRENTNVPTQSLYLMNSDFLHQRAAAMASRLRDETENHQDFVRRGFLYCYSREPTPTEMDRVSEFLKSAKATDSVQRAASCCQALLSTAEFRVID